MDVETGTRIRSMPFRTRREVLPEDSLDAVHRTTLAVLERVGIAVGSERVLQELDGTGARVDMQAMRVRFPPEMVEEAVALVPRTFLMAARDPAMDCPVDGTRGYLSIDGTAAEIVDLESGERRPPTKRDLQDATLVADALPEIGFLWPCVAVTDVPVGLQPLHQLQAQLSNSGKHIQAMSIFSREDARWAIEMARAVAGGDEELRHRPVISSYQCSLSPLSFDGGPIEAAVEFARAGIPSGFVTMAVSTATAPTTLAGYLTQVNAELLGGIVVLETLVPGAPTFYGPYAAFMDLWSGGLNLAWGPQEILFHLAAAQLAHRYGLPLNIGIYQTGAKTSDWQAGVQNAMSVAAMVSACADMLCACGTLYGARVFSIEQMLLDAELFDMVVSQLDGFPVTEEHLALDVIEEIGPGGHYLAHPHTRRHMRENWMARFLGRDTWEEWEGAGRPEPRDRAREKARAILAEHTPLPLEEGLEEELLRMIGERERELSAGE
jgi:trimethylamine--corrinoid protein Co-methyltransferase